MDLSLFPSNIFSSFVEEGNIYFFGEDCSIGIKSHPHLCIKKNNRVFFFAVLSSQIQNIPVWLKNPNITPSSLPIIKKTDQNRLSKDSYVNCNQPYEITDQELNDLIKNKMITQFNGGAALSQEEYDLVIKGINESKVVPQNIKDIIIK